MNTHRYRPEIDGLRALALLPVLFFHAGFETFSGGFVGVDVFFVISGYLITSIISREIEAGTFSIARFYERRARRILPALFLVCFACIPFAWMWMFPQELEDFGQSLVAVNLFSSNVLFWKESGYFAAANELKPLLHTWSLAVEEQFYLFFPLLLLVLRKASRQSLLAILAVLSVASLGLAQWGASNHPTANFYLLPTRAWELGLGALLALSGWCDRPIANRNVAQWGAALGLAAILLSVVAFGDTTPFPSLWALLPVVGAGLLILCADPSTLVGSALSLRPVVGVGLISYSAYLWHQPLFAFGRMNRELREVEYLGLICLSLILALLSWRLVEGPFRDKSRIRMRPLAVSLSAAASLLILLGLGGHTAKGFPSRADSAFELVDVQLREYPRADACLDGFTKPSCRTSDEPEILVWGNSYAAHLVPGLKASTPEIAMVQITAARCGPIFDLAPIHAAYSVVRARECVAFNERVRQWLLENATVKYAVLSTPLRRYVDDGAAIFHDGQVIGDPDAQFVAQKFKETLRWLRGQGIIPIVFSPLPETGRDIGACIARAAFLGRSPSARCDVSLEEYRSYQSRTIKVLSEIDEEFEVVWLPEALCEEGRCKSMDGGVAIYRDRGHLTSAGSQHIGVKLNFYQLIKDAGNSLVN